MRIFWQVLDFLVPLSLALRRPDGRVNPAEVVLRFVPQSFFGFWLTSFIPILGGFTYMLVMVPIQIRRHLLADQIVGPAAYLLALRYFAVILIGFGGVWSFVGHTFMADYVAQNIGWATGSPFQTELAFYTLGSAIVGLMVLWIGGHLITGLVITKSVFWLGAAGVHLWDWLAHGNASPFNIGAPLIGDIIYPAMMMWLLYKSWPALTADSRGQQA